MSRYPLKKARKHLVIASFDGIVTHYCGVGEVVRNMIRVLGDIEQPEHFTISFAHVAADRKGNVFDKTCFGESMSLARKTGGYVVPLSNGTAGIDEGDMWGSFPEWNYVSASLATALNSILQPREDNILILHGTPFLFFAKFKQQVFDRHLRIFYFLHSTGLSHTFGDNNWRKERIRLERECFSFIKRDPNSHVVAVGDNFAALLRKDYRLDVPDSCIVRNGLYLKGYNDFLSRKCTMIDLKTIGLEIPANSKIIFSWGRCSEVKGFRELVEAWAAVQTRLMDYYLVIQAPNNSGENSYSDLMKSLCKSVPRTVLKDDFNPNVWRTVLRCSNTDIVCIPSLKDTNPLTALEAKLFTRDMSYVIVASKRDGIRDSFQDGECYWIDPSNRASFASTIVLAAETGISYRRRMSNRNWRSTKKFEYSTIFGRFLNEYDIV